MYKIEYAPRAMDDMARAKEYITLQYGARVAEKSLKKLLSSARRLDVSRRGAKVGGVDFGPHGLSLSLHKTELFVLQDRGKMCKSNKNFE